MSDSPDLLAQLREARGKHVQGKNLLCDAVCLCCEDWFWPCPHSRALDCAIAGWEFVTEDAEESCSYGDVCPNNEGTRHGRCRFCKAKLALAAGLAKWEGSK